MANLNVTHFIGRLTNDPEPRSFANGGKVVKFGFVVNERRKDKDGEWGEYSMFIDCEVFNRGTFKLADLCEQSLRKGHQVYIGGKLALDQWTDKSGAKRSKHKIICNEMQFLERKEQATEDNEVKASNTAQVPVGVDGEIPF